MKVACIGEAMVELSMGPPPMVGVAGDTLNTAIYMKREAPQLDIDYVTRLGVDDFSATIKSFIATHDIGTEAIETSDDRIPGLYAITTKDGERSFTYWRDQSAARDMFQTSVGYDFTGLEPYDAIYLSGITVAILPENVRNGLLDYLKASKAKIIFDSNVRPRLWPDMQTARAAIDAYWNMADIVLPSIDDEMDLIGAGANVVEERFKALGKQGALKQGAAGPISLPDGVTADYPSVANVVDTTAAGDSFNGGYCAAILSGASQEEALKQAHDCAAHVVQHRGAIVPHR